MPPFPSLTGRSSGQLLSFLPRSCCFLSKVKWKKSESLTILNFTNHSLDALALYLTTATPSHHRETSQIDIQVHQSSFSGVFAHESNQHGSRESQTRGAGMSHGFSCLFVNDLLTRASGSLRQGRRRQVLGHDTTRAFAFARRPFSWNPRCRLDRPLDPPHALDRSLKGHTSPRRLGACSCA